MGKLVNLTGKKFGKWVVLHRHHENDNQGKPMWVCECSCGNIHTVSGNSLRQGLSLQCVSHYHNHELKSTWYSMKQRCLNAKDKSYHRYGGRGIKVCDRWIESFDNFLEDMGERPSDNHSIDRIDNDGDYESLNCRWATKKEQANNTSTNILISYNNETKTISEWADFYKIEYRLLWERLHNGIPMEIATINNDLRIGK